MTVNVGPDNPIPQNITSTSFEITIGQNQDIGEQDIVVTTTDKGGSWIILSKDNYILEGNNQLQCNNYGPILAGRTLFIRQKSKILFKSLFTKKFINHNEFHLLTNANGHHQRERDHFIYYQKFTKQNGLFHINFHHVVQLSLISRQNRPK